MWTLRKRTVCWNTSLLPSLTHFHSKLGVPSQYRLHNPSCQSLRWAKCCIKAASFPTWLKPTRFLVMNQLLLGGATPWHHGVGRATAWWLERQQISLGLQGPQGPQGPQEVASPGMPGPQGQPLRLDPLRSAWKFKDLQFQALETAIAALCREHFHLEWVVSGVLSEVEAKGWMDLLWLRDIICLAHGQIYPSVSNSSLQLLVFQQFWVDPTAPTKLEAFRHSH